MRRKFISFPVADFQQTKMQMLDWGNQFNICCFLDNHQYALPHNTIECLLAAGAHHTISASAGHALDQLDSFYKDNRDWTFGHFAYDLKNETEALTSSNIDGVHMPDLFFFVPEYVLQLKKSSLVIGSLKEDHGDIYKKILSIDISPIQQVKKDIAISSRFTRQHYIDTIKKLKQHILRGDCYEINFCQEFYAEQVRIDPMQLYRSLSNSSPNPFSAYYKLDDKYLSCFSPERYLKKEGKHILSQPIKGTSERNVHDAVQDAINIDRLKNSDKERAENIMVVDLVRNDLSRVCKQGSVTVDELCKIYTFPQVHQMISTISGELMDHIGWTDTIKATFPMGSMTGAPKKKVMELIEEFEITKRGLFSGSIGYIDPEENFDFNVVIRSVLYNERTKYLSFHTGSAITFSSEAEKEYEECLLKAGAIKKALA